jgi:hypothetical protein
MQEEKKGKTKVYPRQFVAALIQGKSPFHNPHLYVQSGFQPSTTIPGFVHPQTIKTVQFNPLDGFVGGFRQRGTKGNMKDPWLPALEF